MTPSTSAFPAATKRLKIVQCGVYPVAETLRVRPADVLLDAENPRLAQPNQGQHETLRSLWKLNESKLLKLARDIVEHGLDPTSRLLVTPVNDQGRVAYKVLEGNRRIAAIKALESPDALVGSISAGVLKSLHTYSAQFQKAPIVDLEAVSFAKPEEADHWLLLRHTGENEGSGVVAWGYDERNRYLKRHDVYSFATRLLDFLEVRGDLATEVRAALKASTFERLVDDPDVRAMMAIESNGGELRLLAPEEKVAKSAMILINKLVKEDVPVKRVYNKTDRRTFAKGMPKGFAVKPTLKQGQGVAVGAALPKATPKKAAKMPAKRDRLIPSSCQLNTKGRIQDIERELRRLSLETYPNAVSVLARVFVELSVDRYGSAAKLTFKSDDKLRKKMELATDDLVAKTKLTKNQARAVRSAISDNSPLAPSLTQMNGYVHNADLHVSPQDLRALWNNLQEFLVACWNT